MSTALRRVVGSTLASCTDNTPWVYLATICSHQATRSTQCPQPPTHARPFTTTPRTRSGHSKWATIKHDKGKNDAARSKQRMMFVKDISNAVKLSGPDPALNPRLALAIASAKKSAVPKAAIEAAVARGQGLSVTGAALEAVTIEAMMHGGVAVVVECQTANKLKSLADLRLLVKDSGGMVGNVGYMFSKKGRIILRPKEGMGADEALEAALEAGVLDVDEDAQGRVVLYTEPAQTTTTAVALAKQLDVEIEDSEIIWDALEDTKVPLVDDEVGKSLSEFLDDVQEQPGIQGVYANWARGDISEELWAELQSKSSA